MTRWPAGFERGRDVLHAERLDSEERPEAESFVCRNGAQQQDVHDERYGRFGRPRGRDSFITAWRPESRNCSTRQTGAAILAPGTAFDGRRLVLPCRASAPRPSRRCSVAPQARAIAGAHKGDNRFRCCTPSYPESSGGRANGARSSSVSSCACCSSRRGGAWRLTFDPDVLSLLPHDGRVIPAFREYLAHVGSLDQMYVQLHGARGVLGRRLRGRDRRMDGGACGARPRSHGVDTGVPDQSRDIQWLADRRLLLLRDGMLDEALRRLEPEAFSARWRTVGRLLSVPSPEVAETVRHDPAGLFAPGARHARRARRRASTSASLPAAISSKDNRSRLVIARPLQPPFDAAFSRALDTRLRAHHRRTSRASTLPSGATTTRTRFLRCVSSLPAAIASRWKQKASSSARAS